MNLTRFTDYALRILIYTALHEGPAKPGGRVSIARISEAFGISRNHLMKVVQALAQEGFLATTRGRSGGVQLARPAEEIRLGDVIRRMEPTMDLLACFEQGNEDCRIHRVCVLKAVLADASRSFMDTLQNYTLADLVRPRAALLKKLDA